MAVHSNHNVHDRFVGGFTPRLALAHLAALDGCSRVEAVELDWRDLNLQGSRAIFRRDKTGKRRVAALPPHAIAALAAIPAERDQSFAGAPRTYADRGREEGGHIEKAGKGAIRRADLDPKLTPHDLRHTRASWHYAFNRALLALKFEGGWSSVALIRVGLGHRHAWVIDWRRFRGHVSARRACSPA